MGAFDFSTKTIANINQLRKREFLPSLNRTEAFNRRKRMAGERSLLLAAISRKIYENEFSSTRVTVSTKKSPPSPLNRCIVSAPQSCIVRSYSSGRVGPLFPRVPSENTRCPFTTFFPAPHQVPEPMGYSRP